MLTVKMLTQAAGVLVVRHLCPTRAISVGFRDDKLVLSKIAANTFHVCGDVLMKITPNSFEFHDAVASPE